MGVMACFRNNCENILCDTYIEDVGYVCNDCQKEFKEYLRKLGHDIEYVDDSYFLTHLAFFMSLPKGKYVNQDMSKVDEFFNQYTRKDWL